MQQWSIIAFIVRLLPTLLLIVLAEREKKRENDRESLVREERTSVGRKRANGKRDVLYSRSKRSVSSPFKTYLASNFPVYIFIIRTHLSASSFTDEVL